MRISRLVLALLVAPASSMPAQSTLLDEAEAKIAHGAFADARQLLQRWPRAQPTAARTLPEQQARYHALSARISMRADSAQDHYLVVAVNFPTSRVAPEALLRLAQLHATRNDSVQAINYLQRLLRDYPGSDLGPTASMWLARVQPGNAAQASAQPVKAAVNDAQRFAIQIGAFRDVSGARTLQAQLERAGFRDVRLVRVPDNNLVRVRIGKYANRNAAAPLILRLQQKKFSATVVTDATRESSVQ